jgi:hypothetical protein
MKIIATYSFLPWLRQGVANTITAADGDTTIKTRATINVALQLSGQPVGGGAPLTQGLSQSIALYGPGDIVGIDSRAIVRLEPRNWITNFESNYFPAIDFYDEDFPWRYTPATPDGTGLRLRPWIALVLLQESEFTEGQNASQRPLPYVTVPDATVFPPADQLWAWAHVHFNQSLSGGPPELVSPDMTAVLPRVQAIVNQNRDLAYSRILCPRRLADNTPYHAFLMPVFETGRLAGIGQDPGAAPFATFSAWGSYAAKAEASSYPYYYRWYFQTGSHGDFEYLVDLLKPQPLDPRVGTRDMDVQDPGSNIPGIMDSALGGVLRLGGALQVPDADLSATDLATRQKYDNWDQPYPHPFETALAKFINLADDYSEQTSAVANTAAGISPGITDDPDPLITAPLYGRWHSLTQRLLFNSDGTPAPNNTNWVHRLNLDPRFRVAAAFGTEVVEKNAEEYMNDAWEQIGDVLAANTRIRRLQLAMQVSSQWHTESLKPLAAANPERALMVTAPVVERVLVSGTTVAAAAIASSAPASASSAAAGPASTVTAIVNTSLVPPTYISAAMRRVARPGARLMRSLPFTASITPQNLLARVNSGTVSAAPPKVVPPGVPTVNQTAAAAAPKNEPSWILKLLQKYPWLPIGLLVVAIVLGVLLAVFVPVAGMVLGIAVAAGGALLFKLLKSWETANAQSQSVTEQGQTPAAVTQLPKSPDFVLTDPGTSVRPTTGATDSPTAANFKNALRDSFSLLTATRTVSARPAPIALNITSLVSTMVQAVDPLVTIPKRAMSMISIPSWIVQQIGDQFGEVMAYPKIDLPMYGPLKDISAELLLPNINLIPPNSITLIETNQKFIEAYMVGLNHDFARKLLWREYPTDQRGSYFRQFWDPGTYLNTDTKLTPDQIKEKLYDIPELHRWALTSNLGDHNNRAPAGQTGEQAVLVIRGELLKKYPTAVIYAHHAQWARNADGSIDLSQPRSLEDIDDAFEDNPPPAIVRTPLYEAKVDPDIYFFGFDLTIAQAEGGTGQNPNDDPGWFFVIKQRPGEPRFGLELTRDVPSPEVFVELTWDDVMPGGTVGQFLPSNSLGTVALTKPTETADDKLSQYNDDEEVDAAAISSARWAYILFRSPVMVAVHADQMLGSGS